jgi:hypothetical protein
VPEAAISKETPVPIQPKQPTAKGPAEWFTGDAWIDGIARGDAPEEIRAGDVISTPPDEWHWHGAAPDHFMTHLSITEAVPGDQRPEADWGEHVTDDEYQNR